MSSQLAQYTDAALLNGLFGKTSAFGTFPTAPAIYVGLSSTTPASDGTNVTEPATGNYARVVAIASSWNAATNANPSVMANGTAINFAAATANWASGANLTYVVLYDSTTAGNMLGSGTLTTPKPVLTGDTA